MICTKCNKLVKTGVMVWSKPYHYSCAITTPELKLDKELILNSYFKYMNSVIAHKYLNDTVHNN